MDRGEFQQDSVLKQLEVLKEEEKEFQNLKVGVATVGLDHRDDGPMPSAKNHNSMQNGSVQGRSGTGVTEGEGLKVPALLAPELRLDSYNFSLSQPYYHT